MNIGHDYHCLIQLRSFHYSPSASFRTSARFLEGKALTLKCLCRCSDDGMYPGEYIMDPISGSEERKMFNDAGLAWIASGDVRLLDSG